MFYLEILPYAEEHVYWCTQPQIKIRKHFILCPHYNCVSSCLLDWKYLAPLWFQKVALCIGYAETFPLEINVYE